MTQPATIVPGPVEDCWRLEEAGYLDSGGSALHFVLYPAAERPQAPAVLRLVEE